MLVYQAVAMTRRLRWPENRRIAVIALVINVFRTSLCAAACALKKLYSGCCYSVFHSWIQASNACGTVLAHADKPSAYAEAFSALGGGCKSRAVAPFFWRVFYRWPYISGVGMPSARCRKICRAVLSVMSSPRDRNFKWHFHRIFCFLSIAV